MSDGLARAQERTKLDEAWVLSDLSTMIRPSWVAPRAWLSFIELGKAVVLV